MVLVLIGFCFLGLREDLFDRDRVRDGFAADSTSQISLGVANVKEACCQGRRPLRIVNTDLPTCVLEFHRTGNRLAEFVKDSLGQSERMIDDGIAFHSGWVPLPIQNQVR
jgi:hypothetical protein